MAFPTPSRLQWCSGLRGSWSRGPLLAPAPPSLYFTLHWLRLLPYLESRSTPFPSLLVSAGENVCPRDRRPRETS